MKNPSGTETSQCPATSENVATRTRAWPSSTAHSPYFSDSKQ